MQPVLSQVVPESDAEPVAVAKALARPARRMRGAMLVASSLGVFALTLAAQFLLGLASDSLPAAAGGWLSGAIRMIGIFGFGSTVVLALSGVGRGISELRRAPLERIATFDRVFGGIALAIAGLVMTGVGVLAGLLSTFGFSRGRQLRRRGRVLLPPVAEGGAWASSGFVLAGAHLAPLGLAEQWRENGRTEHASVASFARLTLDLMALGAPPELVTSTNRDALDEIRHTEACFSLARALDGQSASPGAFPEAQRACTLPRTRVFALATLAVTSLVDGALHEGVSARIIGKLARRCENQVIAGVLKQIAADEGRHAAHGWDVVEWCLAEGGAPVAQALLGALGVLPERMRSQLPAAASDGSWECWGIHGHALEAAEYAAAREHVVKRVRALGVGVPSGRVARAA